MLSRILMTLIPCLLGRIRDPFFNRPLSFPQSGRLLIPNHGYSIFIFSYALKVDSDLSKMGVAV